MTVTMLATILVVWLVGGTIVALLIGQAIPHSEDDDV